VPRTVVPVTPFTRDGLTTPGTTAVDPANGHELTFVKSGDLILEVNNTATVAKTVTLKKGLDPTLSLGGGDLGPLSVPAASRRFIGPIDSARYVQPGQKINVDLEAGITGTIAAYTV
jgi:hypothetical protein